MQRRLHGIVGCALLSVLLSGVFPALPVHGSEAANESVSARVITRLRLTSDVRPRWAQFSPTDSDKILLDVDGRCVLATLPMGVTRPVTGDRQPVGWLGGQLVVRDSQTGFSLLDPETLAPVDQIEAGSMALPWTFGKDRRLRIYGAPSAETSAGIPSLIPGARTEDFGLFAREESAAISLTGEQGQTVVDADGQVLFEAPRKVYGVTVSPDGYRLILYLGNTDHILFNRLTGRATELPPAIESWSWMPDGATLLGETTEPLGTDHEAVARTDLHVYEIDARLRRLELPPPVAGAALEVLDISGDGRILVRADRIVPELVYLGVMVLEVAWR